MRFSVLPAIVLFAVGACGQGWNLPAFPAALGSAGTVIPTQYYTQQSGGAYGTPTAAILTPTHLAGALAPATISAYSGLFRPSGGASLLRYGNTLKVIVDAAAEARKAAFERIFRAEAAAAIARTPASVFIATSSSPSGEPRREPNAAEAAAAKAAFKQIMDAATDAVFREMPASSFSLARFAGRPVSEAIEAAKAQFKQIFDAASADAIAKIPATIFIAAPLRDATDPAEAEAAKQAFKRIYDAATAASLEGIPDSAFFSAPWTAPGVLEAGVKESFDKSLEGGKAVASEEEAKGVWIKAPNARAQY